MACKGTRFDVKVYLKVIGRVHFMKMYLQEVGCVGVDWIELAQDRDRW